MTSSTVSPWPVLTRYTSGHLRRVAMPLGGIGTGTVSLGGRGDLRDWEIMNHTSKGFAPTSSFFALHARAAGRAPFTRVLEGPIDKADFYGTSGCPLNNAGLPRFRRAVFEAAYPFGQVRLDDAESPLKVTLEAFNPLIPGDVDASSWPLAVLRFSLTNELSVPVQATVVGSLRNFIGTDGTDGSPKGNRNVFREAPGVRGLFYESDGVPVDAEQAGTMALVVCGRHRVSHRTAWADRGWQQDLLDFWDDLTEDGRLDTARGGAGGDSPVGSLAAELTIAPGATRTVTFLLCWHFPNRLAWTWPGREPDAARPLVGNYYTTRHPDAWAVALEAAKALPALEKGTRTFVEAFCAADLPAVVKEAALFNLSTLRTQTCFRIADGRFFGWEGGHNLKEQGGTHGSCAHVWGYEQTLARTFPELAWSMREVNFKHMIEEKGAILFRTGLPPEAPSAHSFAAADGQMACLLALHREWQLSGDDDRLRKLWPAARRALEFCWLPGSWDADQDGVMEGCQHNTMDVEYYGPNVQMTGWYLAALKAMAAMSRHVGDEALAVRCEDLFRRGRAWVETHLFNGAYYEQRVPAQVDNAAIEPRTRYGVGADPKNLPFQLHNTCLVDQLVGVLCARFGGLGDILDPRQISTTLRTIKRHNFKRSLHDHFNPTRTYAAGTEAGTLMASYPRGGRPVSPFPYFGEVMPAFEYTPAIHHLYSGRKSDGLEMIKAIRDRHDGARRNPFDECEWGHHYARSMIAWGGMLALTGFHYDATAARMEFACAQGVTRWFWSTGHAWGDVVQRPRGVKIAVTLRCLHGRVTLRTMALSGRGEHTTAKTRLLREGKACVFVV